MGQAKSRGTLRERQALAAVRNEALKAAIIEDSNPLLKKMVVRDGIQKVATKLTAAGLIHAPRKTHIYTQPTTNQPKEI